MEVGLSTSSQMGTREVKFDPVSAESSSFGGVDRIFGSAAVRQTNQVGSTKYKIQSLQKRERLKNLSTSTFMIVTRLRETHIVARNTGQEDES
jgi:hypothetical protein